MLTDYCLNQKIEVWSDDCSEDPFVVDALDEDGKTPGVNIRMEAAKQILDRIGLVKKDKIDINAQVAHGIFILPPKDDFNKT